MNDKMAHATYFKNSFIQEKNINMRIRRSVKIRISVFAVCQQLAKNEFSIYLFFSFVLLSSSRNIYVVLALTHSKHISLDVAIVVVAIVVVAIVVVVVAAAIEMSRKRDSFG